MITRLSGYLTDDTVFKLIDTKLDALLRKYNITHPVYLCHSLGCLVAVHAATHDPNSIVIALNMPVGLGRTLGRGIAFAYQVAMTLLTNGRTAARRYADAMIYFGQAHLDMQSAEVLDFINASTQRYHAIRWNDLTLLLRCSTLWLHRRGPWRPSVFVIQGACDPLFRIDDERRLMIQIPQAEFATVAGAHVLPLTNPDDVIRALDRMFTAKRR